MQIGSLSAGKGVFGKYRPEKWQFLAEILSVNYFAAFGNLVLA
jgi:hypothetical protein